MANDLYVLTYDEHDHSCADLAHVMILMHKKCVHTYDILKSELRIGRIMKRFEAKKWSFHRTIMVKRFLIRESGSSRKITLPIRTLSVTF